MSAPIKLVCYVATYIIIATVICDDSSVEDFQTISADDDGYHRRVVSIVQKILVAGTLAKFANFMAHDSTKVYEVKSYYHFISNLSLSASCW